MTDWSVVGEILGETNLDNVGDQIEDSMEEAADSLQDAAGSAEITEDATESLAKSLVGLSGAAENAEGDLDEVGDEMHEIVAEAQGANASVASLAGTLQALDAQDVDIDIDTDRGEQLIQALSGRAGLDVAGEMAARQGLREAMDDGGTLDDVVRNIDRMTGETAETADVLGALDDVLATNMASIEDLDDEYRQMRRSTEGVNDAMRRLPAGLTESLTFRRDVADRLDLSDERFGRGGVVSGLGNLAEEDRTISELARRLSDMDVVASDFEDAMRAIEQAFPEGESGVDERGGLPVPREGAFDPDWVQDQLREGIRQGAEERDPFISGPTLSERFKQRVSEQTEEFSETFGETARDLNRAGNNLDNALGDFSERVAVVEDELGIFDRARLAGRGEIPRRSIRRPSGTSMISSTAAGALGLGAMAEGADEAGDQTRALNRHLGNLQQAAVGSSTTLGFVIASLATYAGSAGGAGRATENLDDDIEDLARSLAALSPALKTVSANLGPFNIGLTNLMITLPVLLATVGPLIAVLGGLVAVIITLAGALAGLLAIGAIGFLEDMENNFSDITNRMEAAEAIFQGLQKAIVEALAPLKEVEIGGLGAQGIFVTVLRDIITLIHMFAEAAAEILNMQVVEDFLLNMRAAMLGFSDATDDGISMIEGLKQLISGALPILEGLLIWFIDVLPEAMAFFGEITNEAAPAIATLAQALLRLATLLTEVGTGAFTVLLPALALVFNTISLILSVLIALERGLGDVSNVIVATAGGLIFLIAMLGKTISAMDSMFETADLVTETMARMNDAVDESDSVYGAFNKTVEKSNSRLLTFAVRGAVVAAGLAMMVAGLYLMLDALGLLNPLMEFLNDTLAPMANGFLALTDAIGASVGIGDTLTRVVEFLAGALLFAAGAQTIFNMSVVAGTKALWGQLTGVARLIGAYATYAFQVAVATAANWGLISSSTALKLSLGSTTSVVWGLVSSLSALQIVSGVFVVSAIALLASEMLGFTNVVSDVTELVIASIAAITAAFVGSGWGAAIVAVGLLIAALIKLRDIVGPVAAGVIAAIAAITAALLGSGWGAILVALGLAVTAVIMLGEKFGYLKVAAIAAIGAITAALVGSGWGAIIVAIGLALLMLARHWDTVKKVATQAMRGLIRLLDMILWKVDEFVAGLLRAVGLLEEAKSLAPVPGALGESSEGGGLGSIFAKTAAGAGAGAVAGSIIPGAGTATGAVVGGLAGLADATVLQSGGYVDQGGLAFLHSDEFVIPADMANNAFADADIASGVNAGGARRSRGGMRSGTQVQVQIDNSGSGEIDERRAQRIGEIMIRQQRRQRRREDGR